MFSDTGQMSHVRKGLKLELMGEAFPEQYDVYRGDEPVGYLRLRHGEFTARLNDASGPIVYEASPKGEGFFNSDERDRFLDEAIEVLLKAGDE